MTTKNLGNRIATAFQMAGIRAPQVAKETGVAVTSINALLRRGSNRSGFTEKILTAIPKNVVDHDWIRTGEGIPDPKIETIVINSAIPLKPADGFYVPFKQSTAATVDKETIERLAAKFAQDTTFVIHLALARLRDDADSGEPIVVSL